MKKHDFESLMSQYRESLGSCSRAPERKGKRVWIRPIASLGATAAVVALAALLVWPKDATAAAWEKMTHALRDVKHFQATGFQLWQGKWNKLTDVNYSEGVWSIRYDAKDHAFTLLASDNGTLVHDSRLPYILKTPRYYGIDHEMIGNQSVLDYVLKHVEFGYTAEQRKQRLEDHGGTYSILLSRQKGGYQAEITVDKATNRPLKAEVSTYADDTNRGPRYRYRYEFKYRNTPNPVLPKKPIVDTEKELALLMPGWEKALDSGNTGVVDARITPSGTIWLIATYDKAQKTVRLPYRLYAGAQAYSSIRFIGGSVDPLWGEAAVGSRHIAVMGFVSADPAKSSPDRCQVQLGDYRNDKGLYPIIKDELPESGPSSIGPTSLMNGPKTKTPPIDFVLSLKKEPAKVPSYFPALSLGDEQIDMPLREAYARANFLRDLARYDDAIKAYKQIGVYQKDELLIGYGNWKSDLDTARWFKQEEQKAIASARKLRGERRR